MTPDKKNLEFVGLNPEGNKIWRRTRPIRVPKDGPFPPDNFSPDELLKTFPESNPPILTGAQGYSQAMEKKED